MRALFSVLLLSLVTAGCAGSQPRPLVVLVHGRGHLEDDTASLRRSWKRDLDSALAQVGMQSLRDEDVRLAWYADAMDPSISAGCPRPAALTDSLGFEDFARDLLGALANSLPRDESKEARLLLGDMLYAVDASRRCAAQRRVANVLDSAAAHQRPVIVVAYSLGSMVSYAALKTRPKSGASIQLITLGSPLGSADMRALLGERSDPLRVPPSVSSWWNIYNPDDAFAAPLQHTVKDIRDATVDARASGDPHHVRQYLRDRTTGRALGLALCRATTRQAAGCDKLDIE